MKNVQKYMSTAPVLLTLWLIGNFFLKDLEKYHDVMEEIIFLCNDFLGVK